MPAFLPVHGLIIDPRTGEWVAALTAISPRLALACLCTAVLVLVLCRQT